jgi:hypothetical protein
MGTNVIGGPHDFLPPRSDRPHVRQTFLNDVFTFLTEVGNAGRVVNTGTSSVNSEFVTAFDRHVAGTVNKILNRNGFSEGNDTNHGRLVFLFY